MLSNRRRTRTARAVVSAASLATAAFASPADVFGVVTSWRNSPANNQWADPANWTNGVPGANDDAWMAAAFTAIDLGGETRAVRSLRAVAVPLNNGRIDARLLQGASAPFTAFSSSGRLEVSGTIGVTLGDGAGGGDFEVFGSSLGRDAIVLRGPSTYTGPTELLWSAALDGALTRTSRIKVPFSSFGVTASASVANQLPDAGAIYLERGTLAFSSNVARVEAFGALELGPRESLLRMTGPGAGTYVASAESVQWRPGAIVRLDIGAGSRFVVRQPPVPPAAGAPTDRPVVPYAYGLIDFQPSFPTYDHGPDPIDPSDDVGLRPLNPMTEYTSDIAAGGNVRLTGDRTLGSNATARSLTLINGALTLDGRLTLNDNGLMLINSVPLDETRITGAGTITFPGDGVIHATTEFVDRYEIGTRIEARSLTKGGDGSLVLTAPNDLPGGIYIGEGAVRSRADGALGSGTVGLGGHLHIENVSQRAAHLRTFTGVSRPGTTINNQGRLEVDQGLVFEITGSLTGHAGVGQYGAGSVHISGNGNLEYTNWLVGSPQSTLRVDGTLSSTEPDELTIFVAGTLTGAGTVNGAVNVGDGTLAPGPGPARFSVDSLTMGRFPGDTPALEVELNGLVPGLGYDQVRVTSSVTIGLFGPSTATLRVLAGFDAEVGDAFTIVDKLAPGAFVGRFAGLPEGAVFAAGQELFQITYLGGDGNDVVLTAVVPEPGAAAAVVALLALGATWRPRRAPKVAVDAVTPPICSVLN